MDSELEFFSICHGSLIVYFFNVMKNYRTTVIFLMAAFYYESYF